MGKSKFAILLALLWLLSACASIIEGTEQTIAIQSTPPGADCRLLREGELIASTTTLGRVVVERTKHDITLECRKDGYETATVNLDSGVEAAAWGNLVLGGGIGWAFDSALGADNKYPDYINLKLKPNPETAPGLRSTGQAAYDGAAPVDGERWVGRGAQDACGSSWAMDLELHGRSLVGTLWRDDVAYALRGSVSGQGEGVKARAAKTPDFQNVPATRFLAVTLTFHGDRAEGHYGIESYGRLDCVTPVVLGRL